MKASRFNLLFVFYFSTTAVSNAQTEQLSLEQAIEIGLKNNYDITLARNEAKMAANNNTPGNAGMLPTIELNASTNFANNTTKQEFSSGLMVDQSAVKSSNVNAGVYLTWTLFNGFKMFATHEKLKELEAAGILSSKIQIETKVEQIIVTYYDVIRQKELIKGLTENLAISEERLKIAQKKFEIGTSSKVEMLQAKIDMNAQTSFLIRQRTLLDETKINLNQLLVRSTVTEFETNDSIPLEFKPNFQALRDSLLTNNVELAYAQSNIRVSGLMIKETKSLLYPELNFNANYLFARSENQAGFSLLNQNLGLNLGFSASWTIFDGFRLRNQTRNAKIFMENASLQYASIKSTIESQLIKSFKRYQDDVKILEMEEENVSLAKEAVNIALERFRVGTSNSLELKEIQRSYDEALVNLSNARYNAKVSETALMKLNGNLVR